MTERAGSACSIGSANQKTLNRNLSTPILSTTKLSSFNNNSNRIFLSQSSVNEGIINNPTSITFTSIQATNFKGQNTNLNNKTFANSLGPTLKNEPVTLMQSSSKSSLSPPPSTSSTNSNLSTSIDEPITSSFNQNYMQFICSSAAQSPPSSLSLSENCSNSDDSLTMLDDSLTSLQWLQNLNIMKSAVSGESGNNDNEVSKSDINQGGECENKTEIKRDEFSELDLDSAAIPAATNTQKLSCLSKNNEQVDMPVDNTKIVYQTQYSLPVTTSTSTKAPKRNNSLKCKQNVSKQNANTNNSQFLTNNMPQNAPNSNLGNTTSINTTNLIKEREEFRTNASVKPPYSYSQLIILAMKESTCSKMTLQMIYDWIIENFSYFKKADPSWQITFKNSIRHNLSLNKCFKKIARQKDEPGKGGFWTLDPDFEKQLNESSGKNGANLNLTASFTNTIQLDSATSDNNNINNNTNGNSNTTNASQKTSFFSFNVTKRRRNGLKANGNKINQNRELISEHNEIKQQPAGSVKLNHDFTYQYNLPQFSVNQQQNSPGENKPQLMSSNDSGLINDVSSAKKFKSDANSFYTDVQMPHMTSKISYRTSSPSSLSSPANSTCSTNFNNQEKSGQLLNGQENNNNRIFVRSDSNWGIQINCDQMLLTTNTNKTLNLNYSQTNQQQPRSNHQNQMINQEYFQTSNNQMNNSQNSLGQQQYLINDQKQKGYIAPLQNVNQKSPLNQQAFSCNNNSSNYITNQNQNNDRNYQGQMNLNFDDSLTGYNHQNSQNYNVQSNGYSMNLNESLNKNCQQKFNNQTNFNNNDSTTNLSTMPASAMINSVEDMTGTFSSSFAHEIIKSMDDGTLFSFEENLVCNFDQLDENTNDFNSNCLSSSLLNNTNSNSCLNINQNQVKSGQQHQNTQSMTPNVDEFVNEFFKITSKTQSSSMSPNSISNSSPSSASCSSTNSNNSHFLGNQTFNAHDKELIELFEYTSHFNMDDDTNNSIISRSSNNFVNDVPASYINSSHVHQNNNVQNNSPRNVLQYSNSSSTASSTSSSSSSSPQIEQMNNSKIDLTVEGHSINQPKWWMEPGSLDYRHQQLHHIQDDECDSTMFINQLNNSHQNLNSIELKDILNDSNLSSVNNNISIEGNLNGISSLVSGNTQNQQLISPQTKPIGNYFINETLINTVPEISDTKKNQKQAKKRIYTHSKEKLPKSSYKSNEPKASLTKKAKCTTNKKVNELMLN